MVKPLLAGVVDVERDAGDARDRLRGVLVRELVDVVGDDRVLSGPLGALAVDCRRLRGMDARHHNIARSRIGGGNRRRGS